MLSITIPETELFNEEKQEFIYLKSQTLSLEHSLVSLAKWESKWNKPFLDPNEKSFEETIDYVRCMTITQNVNPLIYYGLTSENLDQINEYIEASMTATWFHEDDSSKRREIVTAEIIYYWMITLNIPFECQKWHLNRLLTLIRVCIINNSPQKTVSKQESAARRKQLNDSRKKRYNTKG